LRVRLLCVLGAELLLVCAGLWGYAALKGMAAEEILARGALPAVLGCVALLALFAGALGPLLLGPLSRLGEGARGDLGPWSRAAGGLAHELERAERLLGERTREAEGLRTQTSSLESSLRTFLAELRRAAGDFRGALREGCASSEEICRSGTALDEAMEQIRASLDAIAGSTSDNSTSLIEMSTSIDDVATSADQLARQVGTTASAVLEMVRSIVSVADSVEVLARETDLTASAVAQIDASTREIEQNAREASALGGRMAESAREGSDAVQETLRGIHNSYGVIRETAGAMEELSDASRAVGSVVKIINEINDKTKLLALNAAIIAAQAGEHGKSFAVVAHEIKNLSDRTAASTNEISRIIGSTRQRMEAVMEGVAQGERSMGRSVELAERAGSILSRILSTAQLSHEMARGILRATEEQGRGTRSVMASMQEVSTMVSQIRLAAQEHRGNGESVSRSTEVMRNLTEQVKFATAEQANVGRYISEAVSIIDRSLQDLLGAVAKEREETERILSHTAAFQERIAAQEVGIGALEGVLDRMENEVAGEPPRLTASCNIA
jgi:methyl-accepting chemotaxis protein